MESVSKLELNLIKCKEIRLAITKKVCDIIQRIKDEETKLLDDVDDFERIETSFLTEKSAKLKELELMHNFSSASTKLLIGWIKKLELKWLKYKTAVDVSIFRMILDNRSTHIMWYRSNNPTKQKHFFYHV